MGHCNTHGHILALEEVSGTRRSSWTQPLSAPPTVFTFVPTVYKKAKVSSAAIPDPILLQIGVEVQGCGTLRIYCN